MENPAILLTSEPLLCPCDGRGGLALPERARMRNSSGALVVETAGAGEGDLTVLARRYEWDMDSIWQDLLGWLDKQPRSVRHRPQLSENIQTLMQEASADCPLMERANP